MTPDLQRIAGEIALAAGELPLGVLNELLHRLLGDDGAAWAQKRLALMGVTAHPKFRDRIDALIRAWRESAPDVGAQSLGLALLAASSAIARQREEQSVDLIWTGPDVQTIPLRRTDQALLQVIDASRRSLLIVSFAVYKVPSVSRGITRAAERGVQVQVCLESTESGVERINHDTLRALGRDVLRVAQVYVWPDEERPRDANGRVGSLHAKCAVADDSLLFLSSANLTEYAMELNMELGVLIRGGLLPERVASQFGQLMEGHVLRQVAGSGR